MSIFVIVILSQLPIIVGWYKPRFSTVHWQVIIYYWLCSLLVQVLYYTEPTNAQHIYIYMNNILYIVSLW